MDTQLILPTPVEDAESTYDVPRLAKKLTVSQSAIVAWLKAGNFPNAFKLNPERKHSRWRIPQRDVDAFIEKRRKQRGYFYVQN